LPSKPRLWENGSLLLGITYSTLGFVVLTMAFSRLRDLFFLIIPNLPFSLPGDPLGFALKSLPTIFSVFVSFIASVAGFLFGLKWIFGGLTNILKRSGAATEPGELANQEKLISLLASTDQPSFDAGSKNRYLKNGFLSKWFHPGAQEFVSYLLVSNLKLIAVLVILWLLQNFLVSGPFILKHYTGIQLNFVVPSFRDLWLLFGCLVVANTFIAIPFISLKKKSFKFENRNFIVSGRTAMVFFLSIFEELCSLFNPHDKFYLPAGRFVCDCAGGSKIATLFESYPVQKYGHLNLLVYLMYPLSFCLSVWGFTSLINFKLNFSDMEYQQFFYLHFLDMILQIAFPCFLIMSGFHVIKLIRRIFDISKFESHLMVCYCKSAPSSESELNQKKLRPEKTTNETIPGSNKWRHLSGSENDLIQWIKNPESFREFSARISWANIVTEAPVIRESRWITSMESDIELEGLIEHLLDGLKKVQFDMREAPNQDP
jgi:hypothetical protein